MDVGRAARDQPRRLAAPAHRHRRPTASWPAGAPRRQSHDRHPAAPDHPRPRPAGHPRRATRAAAATRPADCSPRSSPGSAPYPPRPDHPPPPDPTTRRPATRGDTRASNLPKHPANPPQKDQQPARKINFIGLFVESGSDRAPGRTKRSRPTTRNTRVSACGERADGAVDAAGGQSGGRIGGRGVEGDGGRPGSSVSMTPPGIRRALVGDGDRVADGGAGDQRRVVRDLVDRQVSGTDQIRCGGGGVVALVGVLGGRRAERGGCWSPCGGVRADVAGDGDDDRAGGAGIRAQVAGDGLSGDGATALGRGDCHSRTRVAGTGVR